MQKRWHYLYVIVYPSLGYKFYYGSRITDRIPDEDVLYFGSSVTFAHYNDPANTEYQADALKIILWARHWTHNKRNTNALNRKEAELIRSALYDNEHLGPDICLNRNHGKQIFMTPEERQAALARSIAGGGGFLNMSAAKLKKFAAKGGATARELGVGIYALSEAQLRAARARGNAVIAEKYAKTYELLNPQNKKIKFKNMRAFCREHNLAPGHLRRVHSGKLKSYKGWRKP
jgi:hypothetical protein